MARVNEFFISLISPMMKMLIAAFLIKFSLSPSLFSFIQFLFVTYVLAPLIWRLATVMVPVNFGKSLLVDEEGLMNGWQVANELQLIYNQIPMLEIALKCTPGLYSAWLRLWGAKIGSNIEWSLTGKIIDRPFVHIGDRCIIGSRVKIIAHSLRPLQNNMLLSLQIVSINKDTILLN